MKLDLPDFDTLLAMAQENPEQLEQLRAQLAQQTIDEAPEHIQHRLKGLQFQIDSKRKLAKTPMSACILLSNMMHQSFSKLYTALHQPVPTLTQPETCNTAAADILVFPGR